MLMETYSELYIENGKNIIFVFKIFTVVTLNCS